MSREFRRKLSAVAIAPEELGSCAVLCDSYDTEVVFGVLFNVFEVLACTCYDKDFTDKSSCIKSCLNSSDNVVKVKVLCNLLLVKKVADVMFSP